MNGLCLYVLFPNVVSLCSVPYCCVFMIHPLIPDTSHSLSNTSPSLWFSLCSYTRNVIRIISHCSHLQSNNHYSTHRNIRSVQEFVWSDTIVNICKYRYLLETKIFCKYTYVGLRAPDS
uniref:Secreted protein n=1 Tax=Cacopsylla melanoneura TaxID=428564 RepID=A0A8D9EAD3_9HEMI